jgi:hypothetical protein
MKRDDGVISDKRVVQLATNTRVRECTGRPGTERHSRRVVLLSRVGEGCGTHFEGQCTACHTVYQSQIEAEDALRSI